MSERMYRYKWYLGKRLGGYFNTDDEDEIKRFRNEKIAQYGALFCMECMDSWYQE